MPKRSGVPCLSLRTMEIAVTVNVSPKSPIRNRSGLRIREGGVERLDRHNRWLVRNGSLKVVEPEKAEKAEPKAKPVKKEQAND